MLVLPTGSFLTRMGWVVWMSRKAVVVDYLEYLNLLEPGYALRGLVVVDQHYLLAARTQQVEAGYRTHDVVVLVEHGVAAVAALEHYLAHVVDVVAQMEGDNVLGLYDALHGQGLVYDAGDAAGGERGGDYAYVAARLGPLALERGAADD